MPKAWYNKYMPSTSEKQRKLFAIAEHHPEALHAENKQLGKLPHKTLHDFASKVEDPVTARKRKQRTAAEKVVRGK